MARRRAEGDLHGNAPDESRVALLVIDMINAFDFEGADAMLARAGAGGLRERQFRPLALRLSRDLFRPQAEALRLPVHHADVLLAHLGAQTLILTGVAGNFCVLFTAHDAYMRDYRLVVPHDCIASQNAGDDRYALEHMAKVTKADTPRSGDIDFADLAG